MDEDNLIRKNRLLEEKLNHVIHTIESRIDKLFRSRVSQEHEFGFDGNYKPRSNAALKRLPKDLFSSQTFLTFRCPYIRDFRNFSCPTNNDLRQLQQLPTGAEDIDKLWKQKLWSHEAKEQLKEIALEHYAKSHLIKLLKQRSTLLSSHSESADDISQKVRLLDEQAEQVKTQSDVRIFVPEDRNNSQIDWCAVSARLSNYHYDARDCRLMWSNQLHWSINDKDWTKDEDIFLINAVTKHGLHDWDLIAQELNTGRVAWQCCSRYHQQFAAIDSSFHPLSDETEKIIEVIDLCRIGNFVPWNQVMYFINNHSLHQVKHQWQRHLDQQLRRDGSLEASSKGWSQEEDLLLLQAVARFGERDWARVADSVPGRTNKSCRERYMMRARFAKRAVGSWTAQEDCKLLAVIEKLGPCWSMIKAHFPDRNNHQIRNRYELLKSTSSNKVNRKGPIRHRILYRSLTSSTVDFGTNLNRRVRPASELEVDRKLEEIFSTYSSITKPGGAKKSLVCRSFQDEQIYQCLVETLCDIFLGQSKSLDGLPSLDGIILEAVKSAVARNEEQEEEEEEGEHSFILAPNQPTLQAFRAWRLQQDHLNQQVMSLQLPGSHYEPIELEDIDERVTKIIVGIFLLPAILSRIQAPQVDASKYSVGTVIEKQSKNLYLVRSLQNKFLKR